MKKICISCGREFESNSNSDVYPNCNISYFDGPDVVD